MTMIQRPPACERHAADLPGDQRIVDPANCPWCWQEDKDTAPRPTASQERPQPDWCAFVGSFMDQPQYCGEPAASAWHQPGEWFKHDYVALTLTPPHPQERPSIDVERLAVALISGTDHPDMDPLLEPEQARFYAERIAAEYARLSVAGCDEAQPRDPESTDA
jgi:hypothetical protein